MVSLPLLVRQRTASRSALPRHVFHDSSHDTPIVASHIRTRDLCWSGACLRIEHDARFDESRTVESLALTQATKASLTKPTHRAINGYSDTRTQSFHPPPLFAHPGARVRAVRGSCSSVRNCRTDGNAFACPGRGGERHSRAIRGCARSQPRPPFRKRHHARHLHGAHSSGWVI